jgi:RHS repeat-associated protein
LSVFCKEELSVGGLVHLNGRIYDPLMGRMMSADPTIPDPLNPQSWNRYSYVGNDPLTFTDPSGFSWLSNFFHDIATFFRAVFANSLVRAVVQIAIAAILSIPSFGIGLPAFLAAAASAGIVTGLSGGKLIDIVKAAAIAGITALAFQGVGDATNFHLPNTTSLNIPNFVANIAGHAAVGCLSAVASGGKCEAGAISAAAGAAASPFIGDVFKHPDTDLGDRLGGSAASGVVGGLAAIAGGGKFEDGAVTAAFGYLFNAGCGRCGRPPLTAEEAAAAQAGYWQIMGGLVIGGLSVISGLELVEGIIYAAQGAAAGARIALGLEAGLDDFAASQGATTWKNFADVVNWKPEMGQMLSDPAVTKLFNLDGVNVWGGISDAAAGGQGGTNWELLQIKNNPQWWNSIQWFKGGQPVGNPFGP